MNLPKQPLNIDRERQALAPYNFVELPERIAAVVTGSALPQVTAGMSRPQGKEILKKRAEEVSRHLPDQNTFHAGLHSGWIDCHLITASPIYVRAPRTREEADKQIESKDLPAFFYEWDKNEPVIPGSSLRGMLRSLVEIASYGKITSVSDSQLIYRAVGDPTNHGANYRKRLLRDENQGVLAVTRCDVASANTLFSPSVSKFFYPR